MISIFTVCRERFARLHTDDSGAALVITLGVFLFLFLSVAGVYSTGTHIQERIELQNACDAAAYSAAAVQADGLSRMATVNKAMAWTYIQMTKRQMDFITYEWLKLSVKRYEKDMTDAIKWAKNSSCVPLIKCPRHSNGIWWCGKDSDDSGNEIIINGHVKKLVELKAAMASMSFLASPSPIAPNKTILQSLIDCDMNNIMTMNGMLYTIQHRMIVPDDSTSFEPNKTNSIPKTISYVLKKNLLKTLTSGNMRKDYGDVASDVLEDFKFYYHVPFATSPYPANGAQNMPSGQTLAGYFLPLKNNEGGERIFLQMADPNNIENHLEFFDQSNPYGLDHWFIRGNGKNYEGEKHGWRNEEMLGIKRIYKSANMNESRVGLINGLAKFDRGNHLNNVGTADEVFSGVKKPSFSFLSRRERKELNKKLKNASFPKNVNNAVTKFNQYSSLMNSIIKSWSDIYPSCKNDIRESKNNICSSIKFSTDALYSEYEWGSGQYFCIIIPIPIPPFFMEKYVILPKYWCGKGNSIIIPPFDVGKNHGYMDCRNPFLPEYFKETGEHYVSLVTKIAEQSGYTRKEYNACEMTPNSTRNVHYRGNVRTYGDDKEIFDEHYHIGILPTGEEVVARPWILSRSFFDGDGKGGNSGTIVVGVARKQKNPFVRLFYAAFGLQDGKASTVSGGEPDNVGIFSAFDPAKKDNYMWTMSAARAAYRHPADNLYHVTYNDYYANIDARSGCACKTYQTRDEEYNLAWNLCQTDWTAALLPVRYVASENGKWKDVYSNAIDEMAKSNWLNLSDGEVGGTGSSIMNILLHNGGANLKLKNLIGLKVN